MALLKACRFKGLQTISSQLSIYGGKSRNARLKAVVYLANLSANAVR